MDWVSIISKNLNSKPNSDKNKTAEEGRKSFLGGWFLYVVVLGELFGDAAIGFWQEGNGIFADYFYLQVK